MKWVKIISLAGTIVMAAGIIRAFLIGDFGEEGSMLLSMAWGQMSMIDLYTGFILFSIWISFREKSRWKVVVWVFFMLTLGFLTGALYTFWAAHTSRNNWIQFWMGDRTPA